MRIRRLSTTEFIVVSAIAVILAALLFSPVQSVWDGHFPLTIEIDETEPIDRDSLMFATCWFEPEAEHALATPGLDGFRRPNLTATGHAIIDVPASGRPGNWMTDGTYNHTEYLVVEYRVAARDNGQMARKRFTIPTGRGPRTTRITLP